MDGEKVLALSSGVTSNMRSPGEIRAAVRRSEMVGTGRWLIVLTDRRVLFLEKTMFRLKHVAISIATIGAVSAQIGVFWGTISISAGSNIIKITHVPRDSALPFANMIQEVIERRPAPSERQGDGAA